MKAQLSFLLSVCFCLGPLAASLAAQQAAAGETETCKRNLGLIYEAIQNYRRANKDLPNALSDLVPRFLSDPELLFCPAAKRQGLTSAEVSGVSQFGLSDPKSSYVYEFVPKPVPKNIAGGSPKTMREWKRRQMGMLGSVVPIVRCHLHARHLNLAFDGKIYESDGDWENNFSSLVHVDDLSPGRLFAPDLIFEIVTVPARDARAGGKLIDLTAYYNAPVKKPSRDGEASNDLGSLPTGIQSLGGTEFDIRGVVQLASRNASLNKYPIENAGIKIGQTCRAVHFLHGAGFSAGSGTQIGKYLFHFANGQTRELAIVYGLHLQDWWADTAGFAGQHTEVAWTGTNEASQRQHRALHLYHTKWANPLPEVVLQTVDFISLMTPSAPFLVAITLE